MSVGGAMSFFFGDCGGVDGNGAAMEAHFFFTAMDALFFLTDLGRSLFIVERMTSEGMVCAFHLMHFTREDQVW